MSMDLALCQHGRYRKKQDRGGPAFKEIIIEPIIRKLMNASKDKYSELWEPTAIWHGLGCMNLTSSRIHGSSLIKGGGDPKKDQSRQQELHVPRPETEKNLAI